MGGEIITFPGQPAPKNNQLANAFGVAAAYFGGRLDTQTKLLEAAIKSGSVRMGAGGVMERVPLEEQPEYMKAVTEQYKTAAYVASLQGKPELTQSEIAENYAQADKNKAEALAALGGIPGAEGNKVTVTPQRTQQAKAAFLSDEVKKRAKANFNGKYDPKWQAEKDELYKSYGFMPKDIMEIEDAYFGGV